jgi:hypothetical protein
LKQTEPHEQTVVLEFRILAGCLCRLRIANHPDHPEATAHGIPNRATHFSSSTANAASGHASRGDTSTTSTANSFQLRAQPADDSGGIGTKREP